MYWIFCPKRRFYGALNIYIYLLQYVNPSEFIIFHKTFVFQKCFLVIFDSFSFLVSLHFLPQSAYPRRLNWTSSWKRQKNLNRFRCLFFFVSSTFFFNSCSFFSRCAKRFFNLSIYWFCGFQFLSILSVAKDISATFHSPFLPFSQKVFYIYCSGG